MPKHRTGHLFTRGRTFYVRWAFNRRVFSKALHDSVGKPITDRRQAEQAKLKLLAPFVVADEALALESMAARLGGRRAELVRLEDEQNPPIRIADAWAEYLKSANRPDSDATTLRQYRFQFMAFARWTADSHPGLHSLRDVTKGIAEDYASRLTNSRLSANTYNKHLNLLTLVFKVLKAKARLIDNPWENLQRRRLMTSSRRELTSKELLQVCGTASGELRMLLALGVYTGLRLGDCATLRWSETDLSRSVIRRVPNKTARRNRKANHPLPLIH